MSLTVEAPRVDLRSLAQALPSGFACLASRGNWKTAPHLNLLTEKLVALEQRRITRLLIELPPRHGKSILCSHYFPAWYLGRHPDHQVILASYEARFAQSWGERARDTLAEYGPPVFGVSVHRLRNHVADWRVAGHVGRMRSTGVGGGLTGRGADLLIIDDPIKDALEAASDTYRERAWNWYTSTARSRLEPGGIVIVIQTRWHMDDLIGRLRQQSEKGGEYWHSVTLPALCEDPATDLLHRGYGQALWPMRYPPADLLALKSTIPAHWWNALYQQRPTPPGGALAQPTWFPIVFALPAGPVTSCRYWDCAGTLPKPGTDPDWTVGAKVTRHRDGRFFVEDIVRFRSTYADVEKQMLQHAHLDGDACLIREEQEPGSAGLHVVSQRKRTLAGFNYQGVPKRHDKATSWQPLLIHAEIGNVSLVAGPWNRVLLDELSSLPVGHDDQMDAVSGAFSTLAKSSAASPTDFLLVGGGLDELRSSFQRKVF